MRDVYDLLGHFQSITRTVKQKIHKRLDTLQARSLEPGSSLTRTARMQLYKLDAHASCQEALKSSCQLRLRSHSEAMRLGPAQVLCGFKKQCILFAWRRGHQAQEVPDVRALLQRWAHSAPIRLSSRHQWLDAALAVPHPSGWQGPRFPEMFSTAFLHP